MHYTDLHFTYLLTYSQSHQLKPALKRILAS